MEDKNLDSKLKEMRTAANKTVPEVSAYLTSLGHKASEKTVYSWESGRSRPTIDIFLDMCIFYGVSDVFSYFGGAHQGAKNSPSEAEAAPGGEVLKLLEALDSSLVKMGYIGADDDLTEQQEEVLIGVCRILRATFEEK